MPENGVERSLDRALALAMALVGFVAAAGVIADNSLLTHLATGRLILDTGGVPGVDPFSRFGAGQPWTVQSWLVAMIYAVIDRGPGPAGIRVFHGAVGALIGVGLWRLTAPARQLVTRVALAVTPLVIGVWLWSPRPLLVGLAALTGLLVLWRCDDRPVWLAVPLMWLWASSHGSFPLGPALLVLVVVGERLDRWRGGDPAGDGVNPAGDGVEPAGDGVEPAGDPAEIRGRWGRTERLLGWSLVGTVLAGIGPVGPRLLAFPVQVLLRREALAGVVEWEAPTFGSAGELLWLGVALLPVVAARRGACLAELLPAAALVVAAALAMRNIAPASIAAVALTAPSLAGLRLPWRTSAARSPAVVPPAVGSPAVVPPAVGSGRRGWKARAARVIGSAAGAALVVGAIASANGPGLDLRNYPVDEIDRLSEAGLMPGAGVVVAHREAVGNYLTWRFGSEAQVFVDDRFDFHSRDLLADHRDLLAGRDARSALDRWGVDVVVWQVDAPLADWLAEAPEWLVGEIGSEPDWFVACRASSAVAERCLEATGASP